MFCVYRVHTVTTSWKLSQIRVWFLLNTCRKSSMLSQMVMWMMTSRDSITSPTGLLLLSSTCKYIKNKIRLKYVSNVRIFGRRFQIVHSCKCIKRQFGRSTRHTHRSADTPVIFLAADFTLKFQVIPLHESTFAPFRLCNPTKKSVACPCQRYRRWRHTHVIGGLSSSSRSPALLKAS